jgi:hypothetical protein
VKGIVSGGIDDSTIKGFLGYEIGVAITGNEEKGLTVVITEGFGNIRMAEATFSLFKSLVGKKASMNGATQIRAGVIRPEVVVPLLDRVATGGPVATVVAGGLERGTKVRIIREPHFGLPSEAHVRVLHVELEGSSTRHMLPRANVEIIET